MSDGWIAAIAVLQGLYYVATGVWPLVSIRTFMRVTGPKTDLWLVQSFGVVVSAIGLSLIYAALRGLLDTPSAFLGVVSAVALAGIDIAFVVRRIISPIYLADAAAELVIILLWIAGLAAAGGQIG